MTADGSPRPRFMRLRPEPARLWMRRAARSWPGPPGPWTDLAGLGLGHASAAGLPDPGEVAPGGGLLYVPPVRHELEGSRREWIARMGQAGVQTLVQLDAVDEAPQAGPTKVVRDLLRPLLERDYEVLDRVPRGALALWPLIAGLTDGEELRGKGCAALARAGIEILAPVVLSVDPKQLRALVETAPKTFGKAFDRAFHSTAPDHRVLAREAATHGLRSCWRRPVSSRARRALNDHLAEILIQAAELWLRLERPEGTGQELYRAARWAAETGVDIRALVSEGNEEIVPWLREPSLDLVREWAAEGRSPTLETWFEEYVGPSA
ncbi:MAG: hypothetical protein VYE73_08660 [Acidobacteriota bacterium]|nr:hypothetical protein [Acidobacteriota bacterium]